MNPVFFKYNLTLLQGMVISRPNIYFTESGVKVLKFLLKIPVNEFVNANMFHDSFETVSVYATDRNAEMLYDFVRINRQLIVYGRIINIRTQRKTYSSGSIDKIISSFISLEKKYSNAPPQKREKMKKKILEELPEKEYLSRVWSEILAFNIYSSENIKNLRNHVELAGKILADSVKEIKNKYLFNCRINRPDEFIVSGIIRSQSKYDLIKISISKDKINQDILLSKEIRKRKIKIVGNIHGVEKINFDYYKPEAEELVNDFSRISPENTAAFKSVAERVKKLRRVPEKRHELFVKGETAIFY
ncbi:MAG: hypothetical protein PHV06_00655 [bacterium]|nr:hypothetical protein [bacterium]